MASELLVLALELFRSPLRFKALMDPKASLPTSVSRLFPQLGAALGPGQIAGTAAALGASEREVTDAALFFVRQVLLAPGSDHYRTLGLARDTDPETIRRHYLILAGLLHPDRHPEAEPQSAARLLARVNLAYETLHDSETRRRYDLSLPAAGRRTRRSHRRMAPSAPWPPVQDLDPQASPRPLRAALGARRGIVVALAAVGLTAGAALAWLAVFAGEGLAAGTRDLASRSATLGPGTESIGGTAPVRGPSAIPRVDEAVRPRPEDPPPSTEDPR